ncbi:MAG TPA: hypothetical protein VFQ45_14230 [Longimicrobium sp.]|nr:hypothetical protein [Longimicrobium sp.]
MRYLKIALPLLLIAAPAAAQDGTAGAAAGMQRVAFLHGTWRGEGVTTMRGETSRASVLELAQPKLGGAVLVLEGLGWEGTQGAADYKVVHNAFGVLSYDAAKGQYALRAYRDGTFVDADITVGDGEIVWGFTPPGSTGRVRYTIRLDEQGRWHEVGDYSPDGSTWHRFFEMRLTRQAGG